MVKHVRLAFLERWQELPLGVIKKNIKRGRHMTKAFMGVERIFFG
jgi:hypothetical protein